MLECSNRGEYPRIPSREWLLLLRVQLPHELTVVRHVSRINKLTLSRLMRIAEGCRAGRRSHPATDSVAVSTVRVGQPNRPAVIRCVIDHPCGLQRKKNSQWNGRVVGG